MSFSIGFNKPYLTGKENEYITQAVVSEKISGDGMFTKKCHELLERRYGFKKVLLTTSCTDALEMAAILSGIREGDEVIAPTYTFVSTANAFVLRGAKIVFIDSGEQNPNIDADLIEAKVNERTRVIVVVHYAGVACDMDKVTEIAHRHNLIVIEDAAHAIDSYYKGKPLGSIGHFGAFSFHETKNIISGEGGMLAVNDPKYIARAEIIREKGTNRSSFFRGEVDKYTWMDIGSSFLPSDIIAAFLFAQLENIERIQQRRMHLWKTYDNALTPIKKIEGISTPQVPDYATNNAHMYYVVCRSPSESTRLLQALGGDGIQAVSHYVSLHTSQFYGKYCKCTSFPNSERYSDCLVRLPLYYELLDEQVQYIAGKVRNFYGL